MTRRILPFCLIFVFLNQTLLPLETAGKEFSLSTEYLIRDFSLNLSGTKPALRRPAEKEKSQPGSAAEPSQRNTRLGRAVIAVSALLIPNSIRYWIEYAEWIEDWQFELTWDDQSRRIFSSEGYLFDSNPFVTNWTHTASGAIYYNFARYHRLNKLESMLFMMGSSMFWEYITEWREVISVGDNICSGLAGITIGESLYWIGSYFTQKKGLGNTIMGLILNPVVGLNHLLDKNRHLSSLKLERYPRPDFKAFFGIRNVSTSIHNSWVSVFHSGFDIRYYTLEGYEEPGNQNLYIKKTLFSEFQADASVGEDDLEEYSFFLRSILFGRFIQHLEKVSHKGLKGYNFILGAATAFDYYKKKSTRYYDKGEYHYDFAGGETAPQPVEFADKMAIMNLIGPVAELSLYSGTLKFRISAGAFLDFALVTSMAINEYSTLYDLYDPRIKTTLSYYGYYYALGFTLASDMELIFRNIKLEGKLKVQSYDSIEGLDRFQDALEDDSNVRDTRLLARIRLGFSIPETPVTLKLSYEHIDRDGSFKDVRHSFNEERLYAGIEFSL